MLEFRLKAFERFKVLKEPDWQKPKFPKIDYQDLYYYSAPKSMKDKPKSLDELDPKLLETYKKLGIPLQEQARLNGIAVDAVFDSVSVATTFKDELTKQGIIFCPISEAILLCTYQRVLDVQWSYQLILELMHQTQVNLKEL